MVLYNAKPKEAVAEYKVRLRRTAMNLPQSMVKKAVPIRRASTRLDIVFLNL